MILTLPPLPAFRLGLGGLGDSQGDLPLRQEEAEGPAPQEEGVEQGPALGVGGLMGPQEGLLGHLGLVQGKGDQAVGLGEFP